MSNEGRYRQRMNTLASNWRALALRGLAALLFGLVVLFWPGLVFAVLALLFSIYAAVDGAITFVPALRSSDRGARRWLPLTEGAVGVTAGLVALLWPGMEMLARAETVGDAPPVRAVLYRGYELQSEALLGSYLEKYPEEQQTWGTFIEAAEEHNTLETLGTSALTGVAEPESPQELWRQVAVTPRGVPSGEEA